MLHSLRTIIPGINTRMIPYLRSNNLFYREKIKRGASASIPNKLILSTDVLRNFNFLHYEFTLITEDYLYYFLESGLIGLRFGYDLISLLS